jgi:transcriptional regulator NrdR family protein
MLIDMKCPICRADEKFVKTFETVQHRNMTERRKLCLKCFSAWKTMEQIFERSEEGIESRKEEVYD